ncbi:Glutamate receptor ionotropic, delta-2 [Amphibalanus amphitrite]|uniref:Glutamate receptor ionotropic, delta-2 n=1 Tax=Amphibalanus amphitrite TaxID=1232801 RepID=A0A6A4VV44_AMPAM|nr:Glutamate receptor ionotropic, delta-2 [Amphibalanus amphitrite]
MHSLQGPDYNPDGLGSRFLLWTLFVAMFMINASYSAVLTSYLAIKNEDVPIKNFDEFLQDGSYTLALRNNTIYVEDFKTANKRTLQRIFEKHVEVMSDDDVIQQRMKTDDKLAFFKFHTGSEGCSLFSFRAEQFSPVLAMALQNNSPYRIFFNYHLSRLDEGGILDRLDRQWTYVPVGDQCQDSNEVVAGLPTVFTAFTALGGGVAISVAILAAEIIWFRRKRDRARARELLLRWGGGALVHPEGAPGAGSVMGARRHRSEGAAVPWKPAQAVARFKGKEATAKTGEKERIYLYNILKPHILFVM